MRLLIALVQVFDIIIHVTLNQIEPIRLVANGVLLFALLATTLLPSSKDNWILGLSGVAYLILNGIFVLQNGLTNAISGEPRVMLIAIVFATVLLGVSYRRSLKGKGLQN